MLRCIHRWQEKLYPQYGLHFVHASDEWYVLADHRDIIQKIVLSAAQYILRKQNPLSQFSCLRRVVCAGGRTAAGGGAL